MTPYAVLGDSGRVLDDADDAGQRLREFWSKIFRAREHITQEVNPEGVMQHVVRASENIL